MAIEIILVTGDWIIPINDIDRSVWTNFHINWTEVAVFRVEKWLLPIELEAGTVIARRKAADLVLLVVANQKFALHSIRESPRPKTINSAIATRLANPR